MKDEGVRRRAAAIRLDGQSLVADHDAALKIRGREGDRQELIRQAGAILQVLIDLGRADRGDRATDGRRLVGRTRHRVLMSDAHRAEGLTGHTVLVYGANLRNGARF